MKKLKSKSIYITILLMALTLFPVGAFAKEYQVKDVPNVLLKDARQRVSDPEGLLSPLASDSVNRMLASLKSEDGAEVAVVMLPSIGDADLFNFAHELFRSWGIGNKKSNRGLLLLYVADIRRVRFTVGDGLEGTMTDAACKRIIDRTMIPYFKKGDTDGGVVAGISAACERIRGAGEAEEAASDEEDIDILTALFVVGGMILAFFVIVALVNRATRKCKYCGKVALRLVNTDTYKKNGRKYKRETLICGNCGKLTERVHDITDDDNGAAAAGFIAGSMLGGGRHRGGFGGGGGFSGGSWGGGTTSGGGASGGW